MFIAFYEGVGGGCDYTIGCNQKLVKLPDSIKTMEEAIEWIESHEDESLRYFGIDLIEKATIYEVKSFKEIDPLLLIEEEEEEEEEEEDTSADEAEFERLKKKLRK